MATILYGCGIFFGGYMLGYLRSLYKGKAFFYRFLNHKSEQVQLEVSIFAVQDRLMKLDEGEPLQCERSTCQCAERCQLSSTDLKVIVLPDFTIELVCATAAKEYAKNETSNS